MTAGFVRFVKERGKVLAVVDPFQIATKDEANAFYEGVLVACIKEMNRRGMGETVSLPGDILPDSSK